MARNLIKVLTIGSGSLLVSAFMMTGVASANTASISNTGPDSVNVISSGRGTSTASINNTGPDSVNVISAQSGWMKWEPKKWQNVSFDNWWGQVNKWADSYHKDRSWSDNHCNRNDWSTKADTWNSYDPSNWQSHKQSSDHWYKNMKSYMNKHHDEWKKSWKGHKVVVVVHKEDHKDKHDNKDCDKPKQVVYHKKDKHDKKYVKVHRKENHKDNHKYDHKVSYKHDSKPYQKYDNKDSWTSRHNTDNHVSINNNVNQYARSGNVTVSHNTYAGSARSGDASNWSSNTFNVSLHS